MSVIYDAIQAAKREKARRESQGTPSGEVPVLVPLRARPKANGNSRRTALLSAVGGAAILTAAAAIVMIQNPGTSSLPAVPPLTSTVLAEALADSANRVGRPNAAQLGTAAESAPASSVRATPSAAGPRRATANAPVAASAASAASAARDTFAVPQGQSRAIADARGQPATPAPTSPERARLGRLRVSVEQTGQPRAARLFSDAVAAHRAGDLPTARRLYENVLAVSPGDGDALNNLGVVLMAQREHARALDLLRRAASASPRNPGVWNNIGTVYREQGKNGDAIAAFRQALTIDPAHPEAKVGLAQQYLAISALDQARSLLEEVVSSNPRLAEAQYTLGQVLELQGDRAGAVRAYAAFVTAAPARLSSHVELVRRRIEALSR